MGVVGSMCTDAVVAGFVGSGLGNAGPGLGAGTPAAEEEEVVVVAQWLPRLSTAYHPCLDCSGSD